MSSERDLKAEKHSLAEYICLNYQAIEDFSEGWDQCLQYEEVNKLRGENAKLREALEFYADKNNWGESGYDQRGWYVVESTDRGIKAREALEKVK